MIAELEEAVLLHDLPKEGLRAGDIGVVVQVFPASETVAPGYMIEFMTLTGETVAVVNVTADAVRPVTAEDMRQARS